VICHCLRNRFFRRISSSIRAGIGGRESSRGRLLGADAASASVISLDTSRTHVLISSPLRRFGVGGSRSPCLYGSCLQLGQDGDGYSVVIYTPADQYCCSAALCRPVCTVANIGCDPKDLP
jgi:hypothetical protein